MRIIPGVEPQNPTLLWLALAFRRAKQTKSYERALKDLFAGAVNRHYHCLFAQPTLLGPRDISLLAPLVVEAGKKLKDERSVQGLASKLGLAGLSYHPGYTLHYGFPVLVICGSGEDKKKLGVENGSGRRL